MRARRPEHEQLRHICWLLAMVGASWELHHFGHVEAVWCPDLRRAAVAKPGRRARWLLEVESPEVAVLQYLYDVERSAA